MILVVVLSSARLEGHAIGARPRDAPRQAATAKPRRRSVPQVGAPQHDVMAIVNGKDISRRISTKPASQRYGEEVLESLVNKRLILNHCEKRGIAITNEEIDAEIDRMAKRFKLGREQWLEMLEKERGISPQEYARDIVWPTLALRKLAAELKSADAEEIEQAYEREFGETVQARLIAVSDAGTGQATARSNCRPSPTTSPGWRSNIPMTSTARASAG